LCTGKQVVADPIDAIADGDGALEAQSPGAKSGQDAVERVRVSLRNVEGLIDTP
jgi:hypothetical protein